MSDEKPGKLMLEQGFEQLRNGLFEDAIETFSALHLLETTDDAALRGRGLAFVQLGKPDLAEADFRTASQLNGTEPENRSGLAISLAMQNRIYEAIDIYEQLLAESPGFVPAYIQMARLQFKIGAIPKGREYLQRALRHKPSLTLRRMIDELLKEQQKLDKGRYYRPDWEKLNGGRPAPPLPGFVRAVLARFRKSRHSDK